MAIFKGFWQGPPLGPIRSACLRSFIKHGHEFILFTYDPPCDVPTGITIRDASLIIDKTEIFYFKNSLSKEACDLGPFSDLFRFKLLMQEGGWWSDVDTLCLNKRIENPVYAWAQEQPERNHEAIGTSQIAMKAESSISKLLYEECLRLSKTEFKPREALGPHLLSRTIKQLGLELNRYGNSDLFYPVRWIEIFKLWLPEYHDEVARKASTAYFLPIFQSYPKYIGLDVLRLPPIGSYLHSAMRMHVCLDECVNAKFYSPDLIRERVRRFFKNNSNWAPQELTAVAGLSCTQELLG